MKSNIKKFVVFLLSLLFTFLALPARAGAQNAAGGPNSASQQQPAKTPGAIPQSLQEKMARVHTLAQKREQEGVDMQPIAEIAEGIHPLMEEQKYTEAEALVDRVLKLLGDTSTAAPQQPATAPGAVPQSLQEKMARMHALAHQRQQAGADMQPIAEIAHGIQPLLEQQKFGEAEALVDRVLKLLGDTSTPAPQVPSGTTSGAIPQSLQEKMTRLKALAQKREQEGADMQPVMEIAEGIHPLMEQQKYTEAEALVDRALKLLGDTSTPAPH